MIQPSTFSLPLMPGECCWMPRSGLSRASSRRTQWNLNVQHGRFVTPVPIPAKENLRPTPHPALLRQQCVSTIGVRGLAFSDRPFGYNTIAAWPESARPLGFGWRSEGEVGLLVAPR